MERLYAHIGSMQAALQEAPEVFHPVSMNVAVHVLNRVIDNSVIIVRIQSVVGLEFIAVDSCACFHMLTHLLLEFGSTAILYHHGADVSATLHHAHHDGLVFSASAS